MLKLNLVKDHVEYQGIISKDLSSLARILKEQGVPDQPWEAYRGDMKCLYGDSIISLADVMIGNRTWKESYVKYRKCSFQED